MRFIPPMLNTTVLSASSPIALYSHSTTCEEEMGQDVISIKESIAKIDMEARHWHNVLHFK